MTERLFFALWPGEQQRRALTRVYRGLPRHQGRETHPEDLHVTLVFLGDLERDERACAEGAADRVQGASFSLELDRIGCFRRSRILWCGSSKRSEELLGLVGGLQQELQGCGFPPERRPYKPHVTLARKARPLDPVLLEHPLEWSIRGFVQVASRPSGEQPRYRVLRRWHLS